MADEKKIKDEELANITGAGDATDLGAGKKPTGGSGGHPDPEAEGSELGEGTTEWSPN